MSGLQTGKASLSPPPPPDNDGQLDLIANFLNPHRPHPDTPTVWLGTGFNVIWRPLGVQVGHFLELNLTEERMEFSRIAGNIPNRGFVNKDITMFGVHYLDQIKDHNDGGAGLHFEPGMWIFVPPTSQPKEEKTFLRLATIPHGTAVLAQGVGSTFTGALPGLDQPAPITPTSESTGAPFLPTNPAFSQPILNQPAPQNQGLDTRTPQALLNGIQQAWVDDMNQFLRDKLVGHTIGNGVKFTIGSANLVAPGGGIAQSAFLEGPNPQPPPGDTNANANTVSVTAEVWIFDVTNDATHEQERWLQYSQTVVLNFGTIAWPHVTVGSLVMQP
jgi:hypothetical protein